MKRNKPIAKVSMLVAPAVALVVFGLIGCSSSPATTTSTSPTASVPPTTTAVPPATTTSPPTTTTPSATTSSAVTFGTLAASGQTEYSSTCAVCHGSNGGGTDICPVTIWGSGATLGTYNGVTLFTDAQGMLNYISKSMPLTAPGTLSHQQYIDLLSYILLQGGHVSSSTPFNESQLSSIAIK